MSREQWTDETIVHGLRSGDTRALDALVLRFYRPLLLFVAGYVGGIDAAEDVLQELFLRVWEHGRAIDPRTSLRAYLYAGARNAALNAARERATRIRREAASVSEESSPDWLDVAQDIEDAELRRAVRAATASLSERGREVYLLSFQHGLSYRDIAATLGISVATVQTHMARAIVVLGRKLRPFLALALLLHR